MTKARSNAVANAAKGDLTVGSGTNTSAILALGADGSSIVADSSTSSGLRYTAGTVQSNPVLNSAMQVFQRGTTFAISNTSAYTADRWQGRVTAACTTSYSRQATGDTTNLPNIQYAMRVQRANGQTALPYLIFEQSFESVNSIPFAGKTVTLSFYARAGANFSATSSQLGIQLYSGTGTDQNISGAYTGSTAVVNQTPTLTTTWQRFSYSGSVASTATELAISMLYQTVGTAGAADYFEVTGFQIDIGSVALPFRTYAGTIQGELAACQRYYYRSGSSSSSRPIGFHLYGQGATSGQAVGMAKVTMRVAPTSLEFSSLKSDDPGDASYAITAFTLGNCTDNAFQCDWSVASGSANNGNYILQTNTGGGYLAFSAEL